MDPKTCPNCGRVHDRYAWEQLQLCGYQSMPWGEKVELRNCSCDTTLSIVVEPGDYETWRES